MKTLLLIASLLMGLNLVATADDDPLWVTHEGGDGPGKGMHIVLISGDEEYRSEEALPMLARILSERHGFKTTVLFAIDPETKLINPYVLDNIPGTEALNDADLMFIFTRFRRLPDEQMKPVDDFLKAGKPVIGVRTSTHAFNFPGGSDWSHYSNGYNGGKEAWRGGFGRLVLGEKWISHHGAHKHESTRGVIPPGAEDHPITNGIGDGEIWGPSDVYGVRLPLPGDSQPLVLGQVVKRKGDFDPNDPFYGMRPDDGPAVEGRKNNPMMPVAWIKSYQVPGGAEGRAFTATIGSSTDLANEPTRKLYLNAAYHLLGLEVPENGADAALVGDYNPSAYGFHNKDFFTKKGMRPADFAE